VLVGAPLLWSRLLALGLDAHPTEQSEDSALLANLAPSAPLFCEFPTKRTRQPAASNEVVAPMNSKFLHFLFVLACAALIGLGPVHGARAQNPAATSDGNGAAVTAPARHSDANPAGAADGSHPERNAANTDIANDRGTVPPNQTSGFHFNVGWIGIVGLLGLLGLVRGRRTESSHDRGSAEDLRARPDLPRAA